MERVAHHRFLLLLLLGWCLSGAVSHAQQTQRLTVLHTSDLHGQVLPVDDVRDQPAHGSLSQVATLVSQVRDEVSHQVLVLDSGDAIQGTPLEQLAHVRWGLPSPTMAAMNRIGYAAMTIGNHELNFGLPVLRRAEQQASFPFLSANIVAQEDGEPVFAPFLVLELGEVRVGILGLTTPAIPGWELPEHYHGLAFPAPDGVARQLVPLLRQHERCDLVLVLAHTGFERDLETGESNGREDESFGWRLAQLPGIDLLLTGHSHRDIPPRQIAGTIISQPRSRGRTVTRIDLELVQRDGEWQIASWQGRNLPTAELVPDAGIVSSLEEVHHRVVRELQSPLAEIAGPVSVRGCRLADCSALELLNAVQLEATGADISLASILSDRTPDLPAGMVTRRWVWGLYPYSNTVAKVRVTGAQVKEILEHTARYHDGISCAPVTGCTLLTDPLIAPYDVDTMAGVSYRIDPTRPQGDRVRDLRRDGLPLAPDAVLTLAANSYRVAGGGGVPYLSDAEVLWRGNREMTELIAEFLIRHEPWQPRIDGNWSIAPDLQVADDE